jgi:hypothetical protein
MFIYYIFIWKKHNLLLKLMGKSSKVKRLFIFFHFQIYINRFILKNKININNQKMLNYFESIIPKLESLI